MNVRRSSRRRVWWVLIATALSLLLLVATALAARVISAGLEIVANGTVTPSALPRTHDAPITISGTIRISTTSGAPPPVLDFVRLELDRHGSLDTTGLPVCTAGKLESTTVSEARKVCSGAIVGKGVAHAILRFPGQAPVPVASPLTFFNAPRQHGDDTVLLHAYAMLPTPVTFVVPVVIERIDNGEFGYRVRATVPQIAGGSGTLVGLQFRVGHRWTYRGNRHSYVNARCEVGFLEANGELTFANGFVLSGSLFVPCNVRG